MNHMRSIGEIAAASFDLLHLGVDVVDREVHDRSRAKLLVLRLAKVEPHTPAVEESHGLARDLEKEIEAQDVSIPRHRSVDVANADVKLTKPSDHESIIGDPIPPWQFTFLS